MSICINGSRLVKEPEIKKGLVGALQSLISDLNSWCPPFPNPVGGLYKILTKVLANRIKRVMGLIISQSQNAFIEGR